MRHSICKPGFKTLALVASLSMTGIMAVGYAATEGSTNNFFGTNAGMNNTGTGNSFFGGFAGEDNTTGTSNTFFGEQAGRNNTTGSFNSFFGQAAGFSNTEGSHNSFCGEDAGFSNTTGNRNSFFGRNAGESNNGDDNAFFGNSAGKQNTTGSANSFFGDSAGRANTTGNNNSFSGTFAGLKNTASENSFLGHSAGFNNTSGKNNVFIGADAGLNNTVGDENVFFGRSAGLNNDNGNSNVFLGIRTGEAIESGSGNTFIGYDAGDTSHSVNTLNTLIGYRARTQASTVILNSTAVGNLARVDASNAMVLGSIDGINGSNANTNVGIGTARPESALHIERTGDDVNANLIVEEISPTVEPRSLFDLVNNGPVGFNMLNSDPSNSQQWRFAAQTTGFRISLAGSGGPEFEVKDNGDVVIKGSLSQNSDINTKRDIREVDSRLLLARLNELPISEWTYKTDASGARHLGPMAQDFHKTFGLGDDETRISPGDMAGVSLAAVKAMYANYKELAGENARLREKINAKLASIEHQLATVNNQMQNNQRIANNDTPFN